MCRWRIYDVSIFLILLVLKLSNKETILMQYVYNGL